MKYITYLKAVHHFVGFISHAAIVQFCYCTVLQTACSDSVIAARCLNFCFTLPATEIGKHNFFMRLKINGSSEMCLIELVT